MLVVEGWSITIPARLAVEESRNEKSLPALLTCSIELGPAVPIPTLPSPLITIFIDGSEVPTALLVLNFKSVLVAEDGAAQICAPLLLFTFPEVEEVQIIPEYLVVLCPPKYKDA